QAEAFDRLPAAIRSAFWRAEAARTRKRFRAAPEDERRARVHDEPGAMARGKETRGRRPADGPRHLRAAGGVHGGGRRLRWHLAARHYGARAAEAAAGVFSRCRGDARLDDGV